MVFLARAFRSFVAALVAFAFAWLSWSWSSDPEPFVARMVSIRHKHAAWRSLTRMSARLFSTTGLYFGVAAA